MYIYIIYIYNISFTFILSLLRFCAAEKKSIFYVPGLLVPRTKNKQGDKRQEGRREGEGKKGGGTSKVKVKCLLAICVGFRSLLLYKVTLSRYLHIIDHSTRSRRIVSPSPSLCTSTSTRVMRNTYNAVPFSFNILLSRMTNKCGIGTSKYSLS
jgi:hypothetical protein